MDKNDISNGLKELVDLEQEIFQKISEESSMLKAQLEQYENEISESLKLLEEQKRSELHNHQNICENKYNTSYKKELERLRNRSEDLRHRDLLFIKEIVRVYIKRILD
jgi:hypothetical protein